MAVYEKRDDELFGLNQNKIEFYSGKKLETNIFAL